MAPRFLLWCGSRDLAVHKTPERTLFWSRSGIPEPQRFRGVTVDARHRQIDLMLVEDDHAPGFARLNRSSQHSSRASARVAASFGTLVAA